MASESAQDAADPATECPSEWLLLQLPGDVIARCAVGMPLEPLEPLEPCVWPQTPRFHSHKHRGVVHLGDQVCFVRELGEKRSSKDCDCEDHVVCPEIRDIRKIIEHFVVLVFQVLK